MERCPTCSSPVIAGALFCDGCGEALSQVQVARKLRQSSFDTVTDAKGGLLSVGERIKAKHTYVIEEAIARSGFGATFRAMRLKDEKQVLIKQMLDQSSLDHVKDELLKSFKREAKFLRKIKHPAFPQGFEYFEKNKSFYLVMEFINGKELAKALNDYRQKGKVEDGIIVYLGMEIADALEVIHGSGFIYRDLKPQNVMLDGISSRVKLIDFGTLYQARDKDPLVFESEGYTPPKFLKKGETFLPSGDIYSLGALLYEAALGYTPAKIGDMAPLKSSGRDPRLIAIIEKCLQVDPSKRYQKARQVRDELRSLTKKGFWPFRKGNSISPIEVSVMPKTLYPPTCTFCEYCGWADPASHTGYCPTCRVALKVGRLTLKTGKDEKKEFFLYADESTVGTGKSAHFALPKIKITTDVSDKHIRIFRRKTGMWVETLDESKGKVIINRRRILGPIELLDGDTIEIGDAHLIFSIKDAC